MNTRVLFIHRSVGHHLIQQAGLRRLFSEAQLELDDYDNNLDLLIHHSGETLRHGLKIPGNNTNPENLSKLFKEWPELIDDYELIMLKSCYPNSHIKDEAQLEKIKSDYRSIIASFTQHNKQLLILTSPPLRPLLTNSIEARLSNEIASWLVSQENANIHVFDFHNTLSEQNGKHKGMLKREYRRLWPIDTHPNREAHTAVAPSVVKAADLIRRLHFQAYK